MNTPRNRLVIWLVAGLLMAAIPLVFGRFMVSLMNDIGIGALVALGLVMLTGVGAPPPSAKPPLWALPPMPRAGSPLCMARRHGWGCCSRWP